MYTRYFGLSETPFAISPNPRYLYMSDLHREALAHLLYGISSDGCMVLLTGDVGTGKTTLCRCILEKLPENTDIAIILNPRLTARDLLKTICEEFGILPGQGVASTKTYIDCINRYLLQAHANDRTTALIIDEAQNLDINVLEQLRLLTNLETTTKKLLRILLIGQPELRDILERPELTQVNQRITSRYHLSPLQPSEVYSYIQHRLNVAGDNTTKLFTEKAIRHAIKLTKGIPRLINVLCDRALLGAYAVNADHVDIEIMKRAGKEIFPRARRLSRLRAKIFMIGSAFLVCLSIPALVFLPDWEKIPETPQAAVTADADGGSLAERTQASLPHGPDTQKNSGNIPETASATEASITTPELNAKPAAPEDKIVTSIVTPPAPSPEEVQRNLPPKLAMASQNSVTVEMSAADTPGNTIHISAPLLVLEKAGPMPQITAGELIAR